MKTLTNIFASLLLVGLLTTGCESLLDVKSDRFVLPEDNKLDSPNDTIYSMVGIFAKVQELADRYVILGELRGELMTVEEDADLALREINNFNVSESNPYNKVSDYYSVINQCNYLIANIDTAIVSEGEKVMYKEYAAAKVFRAWTYMQIALNYGKAKYITEPILTVKDAEKQYDELTMEELAFKLIEDLEPYKLIDNPGNIFLGDRIESQYSFFPIRALLGDLYLWTGQYEMAAREYYAVILDNEYIIGEEFRNLWDVENGVFVQRDLNEQNFPNAMVLGNSEDFSDIVTYLPSSTEFGKGNVLDSLTTYDNILQPSPISITYWNEQTYYDNATTFTSGDLRGDVGSYLGEYYYNEYVGVILDGEMNQILKFQAAAVDLEESQAVVALRKSTLYLRYAEAVNRAGKPNLAFAVLKNGMNSRTLALDTIVPPREKYSEYTDSTSTLLDYVDFSSAIFNGTEAGEDRNLGVRSRGCGNIETALDFKIPESLASLEDSIAYVEDQIILELALETAFEGNRFHDLARVAKRRNDPAYLADRLALKYADGEAMRAKLLDENNWYLP